MFHKHSPNPLLLAMENRTYRNAVVGEKVQVDRFGENMQAGTSKLQLSMALKSVKNKPLTGVGANTTLKSIRDGEKPNNYPGSDEIQVLIGSDDEDDKANTTNSVNLTKSSEELANNAAKSATCANCSLPTVSKVARCHGEISNSLRRQTSTKPTGGNRIFLTRKMKTKWFVFAKATEKTMKNNYRLLTRFTIFQ